jgi:hypothetical protein
MKFLVNACITMLITAMAVPAFGDEQTKAEKELHKITAMATDPTARRVVSITVADTFGAKRPDLVRERRAMNLNYGDLVIAHRLIKNGAKMAEIATQLKSGKTILQIAIEQRVNWKQLCDEAKKLNTKVEDHLYRHFLNASADNTQDVAEGYDPTIDGVSADNDVSKDDIDQAQRTYLLWRDRAEKARYSKLDTATENSARRPHINDLPRGKQR